MPTPASRRGEKPARRPLDAFAVSSAFDGDAGGLRSACHIATLTLPLAHWGFRARPVRDRSPISEQLRQLGDVGGDAPTLIAGQQFGP